MQYLWFCFIEFDNLILNFPEGVQQCYTSAILDHVRWLQMALVCSTIPILRFYDVVGGDMYIS